MLFEFVVATLGERRAELARLLESVEAQGVRYRVILVDQSQDGSACAVARQLVAPDKFTAIRTTPGLSRARNAALEALQGDVVAFPDDDCWYPPDLLPAIEKRFVTRPDLAGLTVAARDLDGALSSARWSRRSGLVTKRTVWTRAISFSIFLKRERIAGLRFDESLGVGAGTDAGSGEETDLLLRLLAREASIDYNPGLYVWHQEPKRVGDANNKAARSYGFGMGAVLRRHDYSPAEVGLHLLRPLGGALLDVVRGRRQAARYRLAVASGRAQGYRRGR